MKALLLPLLVFPLFLFALCAQAAGHCDRAAISAARKVVRDTARVGNISLALGPILSSDGQLYYFAATSPTVDFSDQEIEIVVNPRSCEVLAADWIDAGE